MNAHAQLREQILTTAERLHKAGVLSLSGHANLSARVDADRMLLTTVGSVVGLTADKLALVRFDGTVEEGVLSPENAEIVAMHGEVYRYRADVGGVVHAHPTHATAFALANKPLPARHEMMLRFGQYREIPVIPWAPRGSDDSVRWIVEALQARPDTGGVLMANHGPLAFGATVADAAMMLTAMEECAHLEIEAAAIGGGRDFPADALEAVRRSMARVAGA